MENVISHFYSNTPLPKTKNSDYDYYKIVNSKNFQVNTNADSKIGKGKTIHYIRF